MQVTVYWERLHVGYCVLGEVACRLLCTVRGCMQVTVYWERLGYCVLREVACRLLCTEWMGGGRTEWV